MATRCYASLLTPHAPCHIIDTAVDVYVTTLMPIFTPAIADAAADCFLIASIIYADAARLPPLLPYASIPCHATIRVFCQQMPLRLAANVATY